MSKQLAFIFDYREGTSAREDGTSFKWYQIFGFRPVTKFEVENNQNLKAGALVPFGRDSEGRPSTKIKISPRLRDNFPSFNNIPGWYVIESELAGSENLITGAVEIQPVKIPELK